MHFFTKVFTIVQERGTDCQTSIWRPVCDVMRCLSLHRRRMRISSRQGRKGTHIETHPSCTYQQCMYDVPCSDLHYMSHPPPCGAHHVMVFFTIPSRQCFSWYCRTASKTNSKGEAGLAVVFKLVCDEGQLLVRFCAHLQAVDSV